MVSLVTLVALKLIAVHGLDGRTVMINPKQVTTLTARKTSPTKVLVENINCVVGFADGRFISVVEHCEDIRKLMEGSN